jgi:tRNA dimethylallyltransferase
MPSNDPRPNLIIIVGPTGVGKTEFTLQLAERIGGEIVSADSSLFYRGMDIGTAKPSHEELKKIPHHLIDVANPDETWSLALYLKAAHHAIVDIARRNRVPIMVGGTGQYIRAVVEGWRVPEQKPDPKLRQSLEHWVDEIGAKGLHDRLALLDPVASTSIDYRNQRRTIRALEVIFHTGMRFSDQRSREGSDYRWLQIGLTRPRSELYGRIDVRIDTMMNTGLIDEVKRLLSVYPPNLPAFSAIGYRQVIDYLLGHISMEEAVVEIKRVTRQFVRRQANWFKAEDPRIQWIQVGPQTLDILVSKVTEFVFKT